MPEGTIMQGAFAYMNSVRQALDSIVASQSIAIDQAASAVVKAIQAGGRILLFGTGHSHMMAEEGHYRAGGLAAVCPILSAGLMLHESAFASSGLERTAGVASVTLNRYDPEPRDIIIIFSNSGVNAAPVEMAAEAKRFGLVVIAVVSLEYAAQAPLGPSGKRLSDLADIVIDNCGVPGDALIEMPRTGIRVGSLSTIAGAFILNALLTEAAWRLSEAGQDVPIYISANMPGAAEHNLALVRRHRPGNPHL